MHISFIIGLLIMFNTSFVSLLCGTRYMYGLAKTNDIPSIFTETNEFQVPHYSIYISCLIMLLLCFTNNENLALVITNICVMLLLILINLGQFILKPTNPITLIPVIGFTVLLFNFQKVLR